MSRPSTFLVATTNFGKLQEVVSILGDLPFNLKTLAEFENIVGVEETADTFRGNAVLKASGYALQTRLHTIADDSGLEVDALNGAPGVLSARYSGPDASDSDRVVFLLSNIDSVTAERRNARFVSAVAIADPQGQIIHQAEGVCDGTIAFEPRGNNGFGYDPIFIPEGFDRTLAELSSDVKNRISHRARALSASRAFLSGLAI